MLVDTKTLGKSIRMARERLGLSQEELAARIARNQYAISEYEAGKRRIYAHDIPKIAQALEVPVSYLFEGNTELDALEEVIIYEFRGLASLEAKEYGIKLLRDFRLFLDANCSENTGTS